MTVGNHKCNDCSMRFDEERHLKPGLVLCVSCMSKREASGGFITSRRFDAVSEMAAVRTGRLSLRGFASFDRYDEESRP